MHNRGELQEGIRWFIFLCASALALSTLESDVAASASSNRREHQSADAVWRDEGILHGAAYSSFRLDPQVLDRILRRAPAESPHRSSGAELSLPMPDGTFLRFRVEESPIVAPGQDVGASSIRTYRIWGVDDPSATGRLSWTGSRLHALVLSERASFFVFPRFRDGHVSHVSSDALDMNGGAPSCGLSTETAAEHTPLGASPGPTFGATLRVYRLAVAATAEYTSSVSGGQGDPATARELAYQEIVATVNAANAVYERDLAIRLMLIPKTDELNIIYTDPIGDPYTSGDRDKMLTENQAKLDSVIQSANYDIGHVFDACSGGRADIGAVCTSGSKARGVSGGVCETEGFKFQSHYLIHEGAHQFGAPHTLNYQDPSGQYSQSSAYEPGSGSTIMSYAGCDTAGCADESLQIFPDRYFHSSSIAAIWDYVTNGAGACASQIATGNQPPVVAAGPDVTIPKHTPFVLTGQASDPDADPLLYCWEEYDLGAVNPPNDDSDGKARPILRSYPPTADPARVFPSLPYILDDANDPPEHYAGFDRFGVPQTYLIGESLPMIGRTMTFRLTVRDGKGGVNSDDLQVDVDGNSGPFAVTSPNTAVVWTAGSMQTVTWDPAGSANPPVSCSHVNVRLSLDGGLTFPVMLAASAPNDGSQQVVLPPGASSLHARIMVESAGNVFFDISDEDFVVNQAPTIACPSDVTMGNDLGQCAATVSFLANATDDQGSPTVSCVPVSGSSFAKGTTAVSCTATDQFGATDTCGFNVTVNDAEGPMVRNVSASPLLLAPPNHRMVNVAVSYDAMDNCEAAALISCALTVTSNESINGLGDGDQAPDWQVLDAHHVLLRAERSGTGKGRVYTIGVTCTDGSHNATPAVTMVKVPLK